MLSDASTARISSISTSVLPDGAGEPSWAEADVAKATSIAAINGMARDISFRRTARAIVDRLSRLGLLAAAASGREIFHHVAIFNQRLGEPRHDRLRSRQHLLDHFLQTCPRNGIEIELRLLGIGDELR